MASAWRRAAAQAESLMERVLEEFQRQARDEQELKRYLQMLQDQLTERVITYPLSQEDQLASRYRFTSASSILRPWGTIWQASTQKRPRAEMGAQLLLTYLPMFLLLILVGLVFALYISQVIYRPIDHLMRVVA